MQKIKIRNLTLNRLLIVEYVKKMVYLSAHNSERQGLTAKNDSVGWNGLSKRKSQLTNMLHLAEPSSAGKLLLPVKDLVEGLEGDVGGHDVEGALCLEEDVL